MPKKSMPSNNTEIISNIAQKANDSLEDYTNKTANRSFNLGCGAGLIPLIIISIGTFIITKGEWITTAIITALILVMILGFANLVAYISRKNALNRIMDSEVLPDIKIKLEKSGLGIDDLIEYIYSNSNESLLQEYFNHHK